METTNSSLLQTIEPRLRYFLPADLYVSAWVDPSPTTLEKVFTHLRTFQRILYDYTSRHLSDNPPQPGEVRQEWQYGTLMFASKGRDGAASLLKVLNDYFAKMIEIISKADGDLLEFTGDALLVLFPEDDRKKDDTLKAVRAGLRMQRAMSHFEQIETPQSTPETLEKLEMRIGLHTGKFLAADVGTPRRMLHILLGSAAQKAKLAESAGEIDELSEKELGEYEISSLTRRRLSNPFLLDRSVAGLITEITKILDSLEPLACFLPSPVLNLLVESAAKRHITPDFPTPTIAFVNLIGLTELVDRASSNEELQTINNLLSEIVARINASVEAKGGVLKTVSYQTTGSYMLIYFGVLNAHTDDQIRAASMALEIRDIIQNIKVPPIGGGTMEASCQIGINFGAAFSAEVGEPNGRREQSRTQSNFDKPICS